MMIQEAYELCKPPHRTSFISYNFTMKLFYKVEVEDCVGIYKLIPKISNNLEEVEQCWFRMCKHLGWFYHV